MTCVEQMSPAKYILRINAIVDITLATTRHRIVKGMHRFLRRASAGLLTDNPCLPSCAGAPTGQLNKKYQVTLRLVAMAVIPIEHLRGEQLTHKISYDTPSVVGYTAIPPSLDWFRY